MESPGQQTSLRIGVATGPWTTISTYDGKGSAARSGGVLWSRAFNDSGTACIVATAEWLKDRTTRIIATDKNGATHTTPRGSIAANGMDQMTARFYNLRPDQIREFQYQVRPYEWVEFENVSLQPGHETSIIVEPKASDAEMPGIGKAVAEPDRDHSRAQLSALGRMLLIYSVEHDDELPETLADARAYFDDNGDWPWVLKNVAYLGRGMTTSNEPDDPVAYDKTLFAAGGGANVLHLDTSVTFESPERLEELGIAPDKPSPAALRNSARWLRLLGKNLVIYANDHDATFPDALADLPSDKAPDPAQQSIQQELTKIYGDRYAGQMGAWSGKVDARQLAWYREHVQYLGKGVKATDDPARVLAYDKTLLGEGKGTNVLYVNARVEFVSPEEFKELGVATPSESVPDIFILSPSHPGFDVFSAINARTHDWTWNKTGRYHNKEAYDRIFDGTSHRTSHDILVLVFTLQSDDEIPAGYEDLLPMPWDQIEQRLRQGQTVELSKESRGLHVILLAAPDSNQLKRLIVQSKLLADSKEIARSAVTGCDFAIEDFEVNLDPDLGTYNATVSIRNKGTATCPKITVYFYRGDPQIATPMASGVGPIEPGKTWSASSSEFALREGDNEVSVVLDPGNLVQELDETNNRATLHVVIHNGRIVEQIDLARKAQDASSQAPGPSHEPPVDLSRQLRSPAVKEAQQKLGMLGKALREYGQEHDQKLPMSLDEVRGLVSDEDFQWLGEHVEYLGRGITVDCPSDTLVAYDKTMLDESNATVALGCGNYGYSVGLRPRDRLHLDAALEAMSQRDAELRIVSATRLSNLGQALLLYAKDHDRELPGELADMQTYDRAGFSWLSENVAYVGKGLTTRNWPEQIVAYDKTLLALGHGTNTLSIGGKVTFEDPRGLQRWGILPLPSSPDDAAYRANIHARGAVLGNLKHLEIIARTYAAGHGLTYPEDLAELEPYVTRRSKALWDWAHDNVVYLGAGATLMNAPPGDMPFAYCRPASDASDRIAVIFWDGRTEFVKQSDLETLAGTSESASDADLRIRLESRKRLTQFSLAVSLYANEHFTRLPDELIRVKEYDAVGFPWFYDNVAYLGRGMTTQDRRDQPIAFDKTLIQSGAGTNVLYLNSEVVFESPARLESLGIHYDPKPKSAEELQAEAEALASVNVLSHLKQVARAARNYAATHDNTWPSDLAELEPDLTRRSKELWDWARDNVEFLGMSPMAVSTSPNPMPVAYCRPASDASDEIAVVYWDGRTALMKRSEFERLVGKAKLASEPDSEMRLESQMRLKDLGKALLIYANDHDDKLPDALVDIHPEFGVGFSWLTEHVAYLGQGMTVANNPKRPTAFDKTLIQSGTGTNVLYLDTQVVFESPKRLEELGIRYEPKPKSAEEVQREAERQTRVTVLWYLKQLALAAILYADDHGNRTANNLAELEPYIGNDALFTWAKENAQYVGKGAVRGPGNGVFKTPVLYWKNPPVTMNGTAVAFWDGHVEIVDSARLDDLGIEIQPSND